MSSFETIPFIPMELISEEGVFIGQYELREPEAIASGSYCNIGDMLLAKITPSFENGKQGILDDIPLDFAYATTEVYAMHPLPGELETLFLFHYFKLPHVRAEIAGRMEGTTGRQRVPKTVIEDYPLPLPPLPEQRRIATVLNAIQQDIAAQEDIIAEARAFKRSLMQRLFTYGPGPQPAETRETEIGEIPSHWDVVELGDYIVEGPQNGLYKPLSLYGTGTPILRINDYDNDGEFLTLAFRQVQIESAEVERYELRPRDIVINRVNSLSHLGKSAIIPELPAVSVYESNMMRFAVDVDRFLPEFAILCLCHPTTREQMRGKAKRAVAQSSINQGDVKSLLLPLPLYWEQKEIADIFADANRKIAAEEDRKVALQDVFKSTLHQLMTGQVRLLSEVE